MESGEYEPTAQVAAKKGGKGAVILAIVFALIAAGLGVWLAILLLNPAKGGESGGATGGSTGNTALLSSQEDEVQNLLDDIEESFPEGGYSIDKIYDDYGLPVKVSDKLWTESARSYGAYVKKYADSGSATQIYNSIINLLKKKGLKNVAVPTFGIYGEEIPEQDTTHYFKGDSGIYCHVSNTNKVEGSGNDMGYSWLEYRCSNENWLTEDNKKLAIDLAAAYHNSDDGKQYPINYIGGTLTRKIKKNPAGTYEHITVGFEDSVALFYRKTDGEWKYFLGTQQAISCDRYDTDELKEAFKGTKCWDQKSEKDIKL